MNTGTILLNGDPFSLPPSLTIAALVDQLGLDARKVAIERNQAIVPRSTYAQTWLQPGDALEIVHFIGGG